RAPLFRHLLQVLVPDRTHWHDRGELDGALCDEDRRPEDLRHKQQDDRSRGPGLPLSNNASADHHSHGDGGPRCVYCLVRLADHSICPIPATSALPLTMASPSRSPVRMTVSSPWGVCATIV